MHCFRLFLLVIALVLTSLPISAAQRGPGHEHLLFFKGTPQELEVIKIHGRESGPTVMLLGGIHGDEPGAYLSADRHADLALKKGSLIVVPRANLRAVIHNHRGKGGDMNRKFDSRDESDPEHAVVAVLKSLMAESDMLVTMHDGSGFYRASWESEMANPRRYGQSIIADADEFFHEPSGRTVRLKETAEAVVRRLNQTIEFPLHRFRFFNMRTAEPDSEYKEHRMSATYYALTRMGIPAFCVEASKNLPSLEMKIRQHDLAVRAFLDLAGVEVEPVSRPVQPPSVSHVVVRVGDLPVAVPLRNSLVVQAGSDLEVLHVAANRDRGITVEIQGMTGLDGVNKPFTVTGPTAVIVRRDNTVLGQVDVELLPEGETGPRVSGPRSIARSMTAREATLDMLPGTVQVALAEDALKPRPPVQPDPVVTDRPGPPVSGTAGTAGDTAAAAPGKVTGFLITVDGKAQELAPGQELAIPLGAKLAIVDLRAQGTLPRGTVMNLKGFVLEKGKNTGEDRGAVVNTARDMMPAFSEDKKGEVYAINAELGKTVLASCRVRLVKPGLAGVTVRVDGRTMVLRPGSRTQIPAGAKVEVLEVKAAGDRELLNPRFTLAGRSFPADLPQTLTMRPLAINLAVFEGGVLLGKVTWVPANRP